ncbi:type IV toxin-antitoxin system AbiEi family antitoxin domain-containing protein [Microbacterium sp. cx-55]|uniref:type IV toxin-antitoxin system AbiEi family antitoxin domain-containing protein n=1 Tax=Microbacterium sp. cx-55 TaxID=2875948 RepID=UPI001CC095A8|nr:type IV toxin-antitoxin system AbiEi family antitoxin domain-containing protein [Microbacterium sp. cx-55]MBZ4486852.1 type IV toxin-antitoxin system AbiEi family antitoxin domain-containing protein [Microbacterium sp. cx-55]UGB35779.1 type IV toxin-antitoxin system AbiEi family antitoxin domain-containing protein [Microbacterium sp. cx-55]
MKSRDALLLLAEVAESQWGMFTASQARDRGVSHMNLSRLTDSGDLVRLAHGVYRDAGAPTAPHEELRAAWLAAEPNRLAYERLRMRPPHVIVSGESAAELHGIGDLRAMQSEFTTPARRQTQRPDVRYRTRVVAVEDVTVIDGLPVTTPERTVADLVEARNDLSIVAGVLRDAAKKSRLDVERLTELLNPLAERAGENRGDGDSLRERLLEIAGIDRRSIAQQLAAIPSVGKLVTAEYLRNLPTTDIAPVLASFILALERAVPQDELSRQALAAGKAMSEVLERVERVTADPRAMSEAAGAIGENIGTSAAEHLKAIGWAALARAVPSTEDR